MDKATQDAFDKFAQIPLPEINEKAALTAYWLIVGKPMNLWQKMKCLMHRDITWSPGHFEWWGYNLLMRKWNKI